MSDQTIQCIDCGREFIWSYGEQRYFRERKLEPPKRCPDCRSHRRNERESGTMGASARRTSASLKPRVSSTPTLARSAMAGDSPRRSGWANPFKFYGLIEFFSTLIIAIIIYIIWNDISWQNLFWSYLISINLVAFLMYGFDKLAAQAQWLRVPENVLLAPVWALGFAGAEIGRRVFHHKTSDVEFRIKYWISAVISVIIIVSYVLWSQARP